jgi:predicted MPP superfamily phosphohydrolase
MLFNFLNNHLVITNYEYKNKKIPQEFNNFKIVHLSDLHEKLFGNNQKILLNKIRKINPDVIFITGDFIDKYKFNNSLKLIKGCTKICPVYFVEGNHEFRAKSKVSFYIEMLKLNVNIIDNSSQKIYKDNSFITVSGCSIHTSQGTIRDHELINKKIKKLHLKDKTFNMLLIHRPEFVKCFKHTNIDLMFAGHAHGGQWRFFNKGLYAPEQGILPKYTAGLIKEGEVSEIISRGLGNSVKYPRINNFPEIVVCTLKSV